jgi:hypothetical protein
VRNFLQNSNFKNLFIEELGWDRCNNKIDIVLDSSSFNLSAVAEKHGMVVFACNPLPDGSLPDYSLRRKIERQAAKSVHEHIIIYTDSDKTSQIWQWVKREAGKPTACREHTYHINQPGDSLIQKLQAIVFSLEEEETLTIVEVSGMARAAFDVERITKRFYDRFKAEHDTFLKFIDGIPDDELQRWYASVMLNRLMFIYFIQKKGFLASDDNYLSNKLLQSKGHGKDLFYRKFLCPLFFEGFAKKENDRSAEINKLLGEIPYLNGGLFLKHQIEELHGKHIQITDSAFEKLFDFFDQYQWHLDERPLKRDNEINPDVLGYIFEKYINQKQMGAYYTKEDITEYISKNTVIPFLFDAAKEKCKIAFVGANGRSPDTTVWKLLQADPDRYFYTAVKKGIDLPLPEEIAIGVTDVSERTEWNKPATPEYALPTEIWREVVARRQRYDEVKAKMLSAEIQSINDLITYNLDVRQFAQDVIWNSEGPELLRAFYHAIEKVTVLDPTCGSGAFLFAALNILEPLYEACLDRMQVFINELDVVGVDPCVCPDTNLTKGEHTGSPLQKKYRSDKYGDFKKILKRVEEHPNLKYFIFKSIIVNNLYGVDIMEEAIEICKLRLFLKLVAQIDNVENIEPLPDIDFNIRAGNTLVGFATLDEIKKSMEGDWVSLESLPAIQEKAEDVDRLFKLFQKQQTELSGEVTPEDKQELRRKLATLEDELNQYLAGEYGVDVSSVRHSRENGNPDRHWIPGQARNDKKSDGNGKYQQWLASHKPFHWFTEFSGILKNGGFDVIIGNPPYVDLRDIKEYEVKEFETIKTRNLYSLILERCQYLVSDKSRQGYIVPVSSVATEGYSELQEILKNRGVIFSSFDDRPSHLFDGLDKNTLSILLLAQRADQFQAYSTRLSRWSAEERSNLFPLLKYNLTPKSELKGCWPKIGTAIEESIWKKLFHRDKPLSTFYAERSSFITYYSRKVNAFLQILNFVPEVRDGQGNLRPPSEFKEVSFSTKPEAEAVFCCFNSTLFRWFMDVVSDGSHVNRREVDNFRFDPREVVVHHPEIRTLATRLSSDLKCKSESRIMRYKHDTLTVQCIIPKRSKPIIDEIDRVLAKHYGFPDEELDFIINYDIKYRMGRESEEA